ncbi:MAG: MATE family multidrug resistance protein, partial [Flavobacteriales bacterium]
FDGYQVVGLGVLRGINDLKTPTYIAALSYWIVTIPACYILAVVYDLKAVGVWYGFLLGLLISSSLIYLRIRNRMKLMHS